MKNLKEQTDAQIEKSRRAKPDFMARVEQEIQQAQDRKIDAAAIALGQAVPDFQLPNADGQAVALANLIAQGPVVITFYRGRWCPYCNLQLRALQNELETIRSLGAELVAISPQTPDESLSHAEIVAVGFPVLSDQDAAVATQYGVAWEVPEFLLEHMRVDRQLDLVKINNGNGNVLPIPAVFVVGQNGKVAWRSVDVDYRRRAEPAEIISVLEKLAT